MKTIDVFLWIVMGIMLAAFLPVGLLMLAVLILKIVNETIKESDPRMKVGGNIKFTEAKKQVEETI